MNIFYVYQNSTYKQESAGGFLWSPKKKIDGTKNKGYENMSKVKKGDIIFHGAKQKTYAISIAETNSFLIERPTEERKGVEDSRWNEIGFRVNSKYIFLDQTLDMKAHAEWLSVHYKDESAFTTKGTGKQIYLCNLDKEHAKYILNQILLSQNINIKVKLEAILKDILDDGLFDYDENELNIINATIDEGNTRFIPVWKGEKVEKEFITSSGTGNPKPKRNPQKAANALAKANYLCEYNSEDKVFLRKNSTSNYTEPHHLIPMSNHKDFDFNLDVEENIVSLCSHCHNLLHYGRMEDKEPILRKLYYERKDVLSNAGLELKNFEDLKKYY